MSRLHVLRVFTAANGEHGNRLGVFLRGADVPADRRQGVARDLGFAETVFVDDADRGELRIFTPEVELPYAGHPTVGAAWLLREAGEGVASLQVPAGELPVRHEAELTWVAARPEWAPPFEYFELGSPDAVDALGGAPEDAGWAYCWSWVDEEAGTIRARSFVSGAGIAEDEATGSAALALCGSLGRPIEVRQGRGSDIFARPLEDGVVEVGGRVALDVVRERSG